MKPLGPKSIPALIDGNLSVVVYVQAQPETFFQYRGQESLPSRTGRYRVADSQTVLDDYVGALSQGWFPGLYPGELVDRDGKRFQVMRFGISLTDEPTVLEPSYLPLDWFFTEEITKVVAPSQKPVLYDRETHLNKVLNDFLNTHHQGGIVQFREWLVSNRSGQLLDHSKQYLWVLEDGSEYRKSESQVKSQLSKLKKRQLELMTR